MAGLAMDILSAEVPANMRPSAPFGRIQLSTRLSPHCIFIWSDSQRSTPSSPLGAVGMYARSRLRLCCHGLERDKNPEKDKEKLRNNRALQATFEAFLQSLSQWVADGLHQDGVKLHIFAPLPVEKRLDPPSWTWERGPMWNLRYARSVLELTDPARMAQRSPVVAISEIKIDRPTFEDRHISAVAICTLLAKLPAAKRGVSVDRWKWRRFSRMQTDLADALSQINHTIDDFHICDKSYFAMNRSQLPPAATLSSEGEDGLSRAFHILSQRLKSLHINGVIVSDELLSPRTLSVHMVEPRWERLVTFHLCYPPVTPSCEWLFIPDPNASDDLENEPSMFDDWISIASS